LTPEPVFLTREQIDIIHQDQLEAWGGLSGLRSEHGLESAIAQPQNVYINGVDTGPLPELAAYEAMIRVANHDLDRFGLAAFFRETLKPRI
jgi:death-on-curing protein